MKEWLRGPWRPSIQSQRLGRGLGPDAAGRLLLRAAAVDGEPGLAAWRTWRRAGGQLDTLGPSAACLLPAVYRQLEAGGFEDPDLARLRGVYRHAWALNQRVASIVAGVLEQLRRAGVDAMLLRGAAVWAAHYTDSGTRRLNDPGLLVRPPDAARALAVLRRDGWSAAGRSRHGASLVDSGGCALALRSRALPGSIGDEDFWAGAVAAELGGVRTLVPAPTELLLSLCPDGVNAGRDALPWIADTAVIIRSAAEEIDWPRLVDGAARRGLARTTGTSLALVRELLELPIPDHVLAELAAIPTTRRERLRLVRARVRH